MSKLRIPRQKKTKNLGPAKFAPPSLKNCTTPPQNLRCIIVDREKQNSNNRNMVATGVATGASLEENIDNAVRRVRRIRSDKAKTVTTRTSLASVKAVWEEAMLRHYPRVPAVPISRLDYAIFKKQYNVSRNVPIPEFLEWVVANWKMAIGDKSLNWIAKKESAANLQLPNMVVMSRYFRYFVALYAQREGAKSLHTMEHAMQGRTGKQAEGDGDASRQEIRNANARALRAEKVAARAIRELKKTRGEGNALPVEMGEIDYSDFNLPEWGELDGNKQ